jgi:hypothetical protein
MISVNELYKEQPCNEKYSPPGVVRSVPNQSGLKHEEVRLFNKLTQYWVFADPRIQYALLWLRHQKCIYVKTVFGQWLRINSEKTQTITTDSTNLTQLIHNFTVCVKCSSIALRSSKIKPKACLGSLITQIVMDCFSVILFIQYLPCLFESYTTLDESPVKPEEYGK